jgi:tripartite ATP-independent transporter DctM subunit
MRGGATDKMYASLADWLKRMPGGQLHTNLGASALYSAVSGSSVATAATISTVALPAFKNRGYDQRMVLGSIAAGASLGNLIPPGIAFIIYGSMTNTSASRLYMAGIVPGAIMTVLFLLTILAICVWRPSIAGKRESSTGWGEKLRHSVHLAGPLAVFGVVMGGIYTGWATVTESAALGVLVCLPVAAVATEEPDTAENRADAPMLVCSRPPGMRLSQSARDAYILSVAPPRIRISPSRMYSGIDSSR